MKKLLMVFLLLGCIQSYACMKVSCNATDRTDSNIEFDIEVKPSSEGLCLIRITENLDHWWRGWETIGSRVVTGDGYLKDGKIELYFNDHTIDQKYILESFSGSDLPFGPGERTAGIFGNLIYRKNGVERSAKYTCIEYSGFINF